MAIRLTKLERAALLHALDECVTCPKPLKPAHFDSAAKKLREEDAPKKTKGMSVGAAIEAFRGVLGRRLVLPPNPSVGWYAQMGNRLAALGMTPELCRTAAETAARNWMGNIKAESIIRQADTLLHDSEEEAMPSNPLPNALDDEEW